MKILALELSSPIGSVAFRDGDDTCDFRAFPADRKDSGFFYENLQAVYDSNPAPDLIVVGLGPGSYAGVRIAIATALGLSAASGARLQGLPSACGIALTEYVFVGDARRNSFVLTYVRDGRCAEGPLLASEDELRSRLREVGELPVIATEPLPPFEVTVQHPSALRLAELAPDLPPIGNETLEPIYLRAPYITAPKA